MFWPAMNGMQKKQKIKVIQRNVAKIEKPSKVKGNG